MGWLMTDNRLGGGQYEQHPTWSHASSCALAPAGLSSSLDNDSIVSLLPSGTEILFALGLGHRYVSLIA